MPSSNACGWCNNNDCELYVAVDSRQHATYRCDILAGVECADASRPGYSLSYQIVLL